MENKVLSDAALELVASRFKTLSEPLRLKILQAMRDGEKSVTALTELTAASQPNVSQHLKILLSSGVVRRRQEGNTVFYSISDDSIFMLCDVVCGSLESRVRQQADIFAQV